MRRLPTPTPSTGTDTKPRSASQSTATPPRRPWAEHGILDDPVTAQVLNAAWSGDPAVVVPSPPGAGKTRLVALLAAALADGAQMRVGVAAQTREQASEVARRVAALTSASRLVWPSSKGKPVIPGVFVAQGSDVRFPANGGGVVVATTARWLHARPHELGCDLMLVDEAWQATYADLGALGAFAAQVVCVGDPGQIAPVVTGCTDRWLTYRSGPHLPAPVAIAAAHGHAVTRTALRHTWRLGPQTTALIGSTFYPDLPFTSKRPPEHVTDPSGTTLAEVTGVPVQSQGGTCDPRLLAACADRVRTLLTHALTTAHGTRPLTAADVAVVCSHVAASAAVRACLADLPDVLVGTANQLQGLERPAVVALHPLAGLREVSEFDANPGRACVMLSRHRAHLSIITDTATASVLSSSDLDMPGVSTHCDLLTALTA